MCGNVIGPVYKVILTLPGVDDVLAMLLALAAKPEELDILLLSVTYGNVEVERYGFYRFRKTAK